jgi:Tol biopolymer transport system component/serine/threonine protein kinase
MTGDPARWRRLESVVHAALARPAEERAVFLAEACSGDSDLQREAASLLERDACADAFLGTPLEALAAGAMADSPEASGQTGRSAAAIGQTLAHYRIIKAIGAGGMGQVYLAEDTRLDRQVALKILPPELGDDADRRARFTREAKAVAVLNHPNIVTAYAVEEAGGFHFITMELVRGRTLAELLPRSGFALHKFLELAIPLTDALAAAHQHGITHRDVKPTNVMVTDEGRVKVLDFGLAKAHRDVRDHDGTLAPRSATEEGHIVGTPAYMSPEQAEGKSVDARSDIFSLGVLFYEMLTGQRPFGGETSASILASVVKDTPTPIAGVKPGVPRDVARLVHRCLAKAPIDRFQSAIDLRHDLEDARQALTSDAEPSGDAIALRRRSRSLRLAVVGAVIGSAAVIALTTLALSNGRFRTPGGADGPPAAPRLANAVKITSSLSIETDPTWSPDGSRLAYEVGDTFAQGDTRHIWVSQVGGGEPVNLTRDSPGNNRRPSWSPDGRDIAFYSNRDGEWGVYLLPAIGGSPRKVHSLPGFVGGMWSAPQWSKDGTVLFVPAQLAPSNRIVLYAVPLASLQSTQVELPAHDSLGVWDLSVSPDDQRLAYVEAGPGNPDISRLWTIAMSGGTPIPLTDGRTNVWSPTWSGDGRTLFYVSNRGGSMDLWQQALSADGTALGEALQVTQGLGILSAAYSPDGRRLAYSKGGPITNVWRAPIFADRAATWADATPVTSERSYIEFVDVSPDGTQLALSSDRRGNQDLWLLPSAGGAMTPLTNDPTPDWNPRWSPDGSQIAFYAYRSGNRDIWVMPSRGGPARQLTARPGTDWFPFWSPDGRDIGFQALRGNVNELWTVSAAGGEPRLVTEGGSADWSPDGESFVFRRPRPGRLFRIARHGGDATPLPSPRSANTPRFSRDGQFVYFCELGATGQSATLWRMSLRDGRSSKLVSLEGRPGHLEYYFAADARFLYFIWGEPEGDIWVMDVTTDKTK